MDVTLDSISNIRLFQSRKGYRFSVDALLLADFVNLKKVVKIGDLGAGSGIVGILLAKKYPDARVTLFEIQDSLAALAEKNVALNNLRDRVTVMKADVKGLRLFDSSFAVPHSFDLLVSNPPFRRLKSGRISEGEEKAIARHEIKLGIHDLINAASSLLKAKGRLCVIYHPSRLMELFDILKKKRIEAKRLRFVHSNISSEAKMVLLEAVQGGRGGIKVDRPLNIYRDDGSYTDEVIGICNP
jgi:tRNA1Val (adenine37-N6)-methyltransferase